MKNIRTLLFAASALAFINVAYAQTAVSANASVTATPAPSYSNDPMVQKRHDDSVSKKEYKAAKKDAKQEMKADKKEAKAEFKAEKAESTEIRNAAMTGNPVGLSVATPAYSNDPMVQKRHDDSVAKKEYKAAKKDAKQEMKAEKKEAKVELKADKAESTAVRNSALIANPIVPSKP